MTICLLDSSILCNFLNIRIKFPGHCVGQQWLMKIHANERFALSLAAIIETGNHISHLSDGQLRRQKAVRLVEMVQSALAKVKPFIIYYLPVKKRFGSGLPSFRSCQPRNRYGGLSITEDFHKLVSLYKQEKVYIWTLDSHLLQCQHIPENIAKAKKK